MACQARRRLQPDAPWDMLTSLQIPFAPILFGFFSEWQTAVALCKDDDSDDDGFADGRTNTASDSC